MKGIISEELLSKAVVDVATAMKAARIERHLSIGTLAETIGISVPTYRQIEAGNQKVMLATFLKCVSYFGMSDTFFKMLLEISRGDDE